MTVLTWISVMLIHSGHVALMGPSPNKYAKLYFQGCRVYFAGVQCHCIAVIQRFDIKSMCGTQSALVIFTLQ